MLRIGFKGGHQSFGGEGMQRFIILIGMGFVWLSAELPALASDDRVYACSVEQLYGIQDGRIQPSRFTEKAFVATWTPARIKGEKPYRSYEAAQFNMNVKFASHTGGLFKNAHHFRGAYHAYEHRDASEFDNGAQSDFVDDKRQRSPEEVVKGIQPEGHYSNLTDSFLLFQEGDGRLAYILRAHESEEEVKGRIATGHCSAK